MSVGGLKTKGHPEVWAVLTIITFPIVLLSANALGAPSLWPFLIALISTAFVLFLEAIVRGRLWPFEPGFIEHIAHPATPVRLVVFISACLLILETAFLLILSVDRRYDAGLLSWIEHRQCASAYDLRANPLCLFMNRRAISTQQTTTGDSVGLAMRMQAAKLWFPDEPLVTCAERKIVRSAIIDTTCTNASLMRCTAWQVNDKGILHSKKSITRFVGATLERHDDGFYRVVAWSDDYASPNWDTALGSISERSRQTAQSLSFMQDFVTVLDAEAYGRAQQILQK